MIVADTHALLWWVAARERLSSKAREALDTNPIRVSTISCFEITALVQRNRFGLGVDVRTWLENVLALPNVALLPFTTEVAVTAGMLRDPVRDPADRIIVATALLQGVPLVTKDRKIIASAVVPTIW